MCTKQQFNSLANQVNPYIAMTEMLFFSYGKCDPHS